MKATIKTEDGKIFIGELVEEKKGRWRAEFGKNYYISDSGDVGVSTEQRDVADNNRWETGNYYETEEEAERIGLAKQEEDKAIQRVKDYILENFGEWTPDWRDSNQLKFSFYFDHYKGRVGYYGNFEHQNYSPFGYLETGKQAEQVIKDCKEDLEILFNH